MLIKTKKKKRKRDYTTSKAAIQIRKKKTSIHFLSHPSSSSRVLPDYPHHAQALSAVREKKNDVRTTKRCPLLL